MLVMLFFSGIVELWIELWTKNFETKLCSWNLSECLWKLNVKTLPFACSYATQPENLLKVIVSLGKPNLWWNFGSCALVLLTKYLYFFISTRKRVYFTNILKQRKRWNKLEPPATRKNELKPPETSCDKMELVKNGTWKSNGSWLQRSFECKRFLTRFFKKNIYLLDLVKDQRTEVVLYKEWPTTRFPVFFLCRMSY